MRVTARSLLNNELRQCLALTLGLTWGLVGCGSSATPGADDGSSGAAQSGNANSAGSGVTAGGASSSGAGGVLSTGGSADNAGSGMSLGNGGSAGSNSVAGGGGSAGQFAIAGNGGSATGGASGAGAATGGASGVGAAGSAGTAGSGGTPTGSATIINDRFWKDTSGTPIYSQGGGVLRAGDTYYWYGVKYGGAPTYAAKPTGLNSDTSFQGITTYSSTDLVTWKLEATDQPVNTGGWFGRLGVAYNATSKKYVLVAQGDGGLYFATSTKPNGGFTFDNVQTNLPGIVNGATGDQTIFQDDDGQAYLVSSSSNGRANRYVSPLRAADFLAADDAVLVYKGGGREGNCMFKYNSNYYFCSSDLHGWNASQTYCVSASNIKGPYGAEFVLDGTGPDYSHVTQTGFFISVKGSAQTTVIFAGDRWSDFAGNGLGFNQWMPLTFTGATAHFQSLSEWAINAGTGTWSVAPGNNFVLNPSIEADRVAVTTPTGWVATSGSNVTGGHTGRWSWQLTGTSSLSQTIAALPNGAYTLSVWVKSSAAGAQLYVKSFGGTQKMSAIPSATAWTNVTITGITASSGSAEVGVTGTGQTVTVDDFVLSSG